jgi:hypothetical protein
MLISTRHANFTYITSSSVAPQAKVTTPTPLDVDLSYLLSILNEKDRIAFSISRSKNSCHTPRRNADVDAAMKFFSDFYTWAGSVSSYFVDHLFPMQVQHQIDVSALNVDGVFIPVLALFEDRGEEGVLALPDTKGHSSSPRLNEGATPSGVQVVLSHKSNKNSPLLTGKDLNIFLAEMARSFEEKQSTLRKVFPSDKGIVSLPEASLITSLKLVQQVSQYYGDGMDYIEDMLRQVDRKKRSQIILKLIFRLLNFFLGPY